MATNDILKNIPFEELPQLIDLLIERLGRTDSNHMVNYIKNLMDWFDRYSENSYVNIMAPNGDWRSNGTFIINVDVPDNAIVNFFSLESSNEQLLNGLLLTKRIRWDQPIFFAMISEYNYSVVYRIVEERNLQIPEKNPECYLYRINKEEALKYEYSYPEDVTMLPLRPSDAVMINDVWPHRTETSIKYIEATIERNDNLGLFVRETNELASWAVVSFLGAIASLQTADAHKKKGYGTIVTKAMAKRMAQRGWDPCASVVLQNMAPQKLFGSLGFERQSQKVTFYFSIVKDKMK